MVFRVGNEERDPYCSSQFILSNAFLTSLQINHAEKIDRTQWGHMGILDSTVVLLGQALCRARRRKWLVLKA